MDRRLAVMATAHLSASRLHLVKKNSGFVVKSLTSVSVRAKSQQAPSQHGVAQASFALLSIQASDTASLTTEVELPIALHKCISLVSAYPNTGTVSKWRKHQDFSCPVEWASQK